MIKKISESELTKMCVELLSKTYLDLGQHNVDAKTKVLMAQSLAYDLKKSFKNLLWIDIKMAFWNGVRNEEEFMISAKTYYGLKSGGPLYGTMKIFQNNKKIKDYLTEVKLN